MIEKNETSDSDIINNERKMHVRILFGIFWLLIIHFGVYFFVNSIFAGIAGASSTSTEEGIKAAKVATTSFFANYRYTFFSGELGVFLLMLASGILPGTGRWITD